MEERSINPQDFFVLVVDDVPVNLKILSRILEPIGYQVSYAMGGQQALKQIEITKPDIILLDLIMPDIDGLGVCRILKKNPEYFEIPIIFLTAKHEKECLIQAFEEGAVDYVTKPFNKLELLARINTHLKLKHYRDCLQNQAEQERLMSHITKSIHCSLHLTDILQTSVTEIRQFLHTDRVIICYFTAPHQGKVIAESHINTCKSLLGQEISHLSGIEQSSNSSEVLRFQTTYNTSNSDISPFHRDFLTTWQVKAELTIPLYQQTNLWGTLIAHHCQNFHTWSRREIQLLFDISKQIEIAIQQSELYQKLNIANQELEFLANTDGLTKVANRRQFDQRINQEWLRLKREQMPLSLIICDVDHFKLYNDYYGHPSGDICLQKIAQALSKTIKRPADLVARYGGEEFAVILPNTGLDGAIKVAQLIKQAMAELNISHIPDFSGKIITLSLGVASLIPHPNLTPDDLIKIADKALYSAKSQGRNQLVALSI